MKPFRHKHRDRGLRHPEAAWAKHRVDCVMPSPPGRSASRALQLTFNNLTRQPPGSSRTSSSIVRSHIGFLQRLLVSPRLLSQHRLVGACIKQRYPVDRRPQLLLQTLKEAVG